MKKTLLLVALFLGCSLACVVCAQDTVTGAFEGIVTNSQTGAPIAGAQAEIINLETGLTITKRSDARGRFYQGLLRPGIYRIRVSYDGFQPREVLQRLDIARTGEVVPVPVNLDPLTAVIATNPPPVPPTASDTAIRAGINTSDATRRGSFAEDTVVSLPLGGVTLTRTFDELALLTPGVAPPPQTLGSVAGPGQGAGVGSAGQFAVNGLRSRANNFTVDGSDNNDEDIGVRRQGFVALIPQPLESIKEYQIITLLAPAQFGRNLGGQVNAVSKSGGAETHGALYGFFNSSQLNARNHFDSQTVAETVRVRAASGQEVFLDGRPLDVTNNAGGEDSFTLGKAGGVLGGPLRRATTFYFLAVEAQKINARSEEHFAVPTVEQRGLFGTGATGLFENPFNRTQLLQGRPASGAGNDVFSLFPFPNQPTGVYGANTFTQTLPASGRGAVASLKLDHHFKLGGREQSVTGRYNFTDDWREIPTTGEALYAALRPETRAQNFSFFFHSQLSADGAATEILNQVRLSYGRTRLRFLEVRDPGLLPSDDFPNEPFLLNRPRLMNNTRPATAGAPNTGVIAYSTNTSTSPRLRNTEGSLGPLGQVLLAGFSPLGVDVYNFPQRRVNNTFQFADNLTLRAGAHSWTFGTDNRRTELNSNLPRVFRPFVSFHGAPQLTVQCDAANANCRFSQLPGAYFSATDLAATGAPSNLFLTLGNAGAASGVNFAADCQAANTANCRDANINLRFYQLNFFAQDDWRLRRKLSLALGLRYEYNTPPRERRRLIENSFNDPALDLIRCAAGTAGSRCGFRPFLDGRTEIFTPDRNDLAPRLSLAYAPEWFGQQRTTVLRAGFGLYYDQVLGAVVSQSRNVYPTFLTLNFGGLDAATGGDLFLLFTNPARIDIGGPLVRNLTLNQLNVPLNRLLSFLSQSFPSALGATLPTRQLATPAAAHYSFAFEQQLSRDLTISAAYVGTQGRHLLRFTTPNLGPATNLVPRSLTVSGVGNPGLSGRLCAPSVGALCTAGRPVEGVGAIHQFETSANSRYDALQLEVRGRFRQALQLQASYVFSSARDDVSDVYALAGAPALPQNSLNLAAERGPANFDIRQRATFALVYQFRASKDGPARLLSGLQLAGSGRLQTGQPFTVNSIFDVNLDGNLTDRLNTVNGLLPTYRGRQPLILQTDNPGALLASAGQAGGVGRNTFRAGGLAEVDLSLSRTLSFAGSRRLALRADLFNLLNRANYGIPVRWLEAPGFGQAVRTVTPGLRAQLGLKLEF